MDGMDDAGFTRWFAAELAGLPGVLAITLGGSRASGTNHAGSDWDFAIYYRQTFDPFNLRNKGWAGTVSDIGGWGGGVMNGGAWLTEQASKNWLADARASLWYAATALDGRGDVPVALANASRGLIEAAHARLAGRGEWVLNEKRIVAKAGLAALADLLLAASGAAELGGALASIRAEIGRFERGQ